MDDEPLHLVDSDEPPEPEVPGAVLPGVVPCAECTILIGPRYIETQPFVHPARPGLVCWRCYESLERRVQREDAGPTQHARDPRQRR